MVKGTWWDSYQSIEEALTETETAEPAQQWQEHVRWQQWSGCSVEPEKWWQENSFRKSIWAVGESSQYQQLQQLGLQWCGVYLGRPTRGRWQLQVAGRKGSAAGEKRCGFCLHAVFKEIPSLPKASQPMRSSYIHRRNTLIAVSITKKINPVYLKPGQHVIYHHWFQVHSLH